MERIRSTSRVAWSMCLAAIAVGTASVRVTGPSGIPAAAATASIAVAFLGYGCVVFSIKVSHEAGSSQILKELRSMKIVLDEGDRLVLSRTE